MNQRIVTKNLLVRVVGLFFQWRTHGDPGDQLQFTVIEVKVKIHFLAASVAQQHRS